MCIASAAACVPACTGLWNHESGKQGVNTCQATERGAGPCLIIALPLHCCLLAGRTGRPPVHPNTVDRRRGQQRRLSFGGADSFAVATASAAAAARPTPSEQRRTSGASTPLDKLSSELDSAARRERRQQQREQQAQQEQQVHPSQSALAASLADAGELDFGGAERLLSEQDADAELLASMPEQLRRMSTDGIISMDTLRVGWALVPLVV